MAKTMCPITQKECYMHAVGNYEKDETFWVECAFEDDDKIGCLVKKALEEHAKMAFRLAENFWKNNHMDDPAFGVFHTNSAE